MAEETADDGDATVTLDADTAPWERALERAQQSLNGWANRTSERFDALRESIKAKTTAITETIGNIRERAAESGDWGATIGASLGEAIGGRFGPLGTEIGTEIGTRIGKAVGSAVDLDAVTAKLTEIAPLAGQQLDEIGKSAAAFRTDFEATWAGIREAVEAADLGNVMSGSFDAGFAKVDALFADLSTRIEDFAGRTSIRLRDAIDGAVERFKEPVSRLVDGFQNILERVGLLKGETASWGQALRDVKDVGQTVIEALVKGLAYVNDALVKVRGYLQILGSTLTQLAADFTRQLASALAVLKDLPESLGGGAGGLAASFEGVLKAQARRLEAHAARLRELGDKGAARDIGASADEWVKNLRGRQAGFALAVDVQAGLEAGFKRINEGLNWWKEFTKPQMAPENGPAAALAAVDRRAGAASAGSREALASIIQNAGGRGANDPAQRAAAAAEANVKNGAAAVGELGKLNRKLDQPLKLDVNAF